MSIISGIEADAEKVLTWLGKETTKIAAAEPAVAAALGTLLGGLNTAINNSAADVSGGVTVPLTGTAATSIKAIWPEIVAFAETLGIKI